jgi:hypothetical protein
VLPGAADADQSLGHTAFISWSGPNILGMSRCQLLSCGFPQRTSHSDNAISGAYPFRYNLKET